MYLTTINSINKLYHENQELQKVKSENYELKHEIDKLQKRINNLEDKADLESPILENEKYNELQKKL